MKSTSSKGRRMQRQLIYCFLMGLGLILLLGSGCDNEPAAVAATATERPGTDTPQPTIDPNTPPACTSIGQTWTSPIDGMTLVCVPVGEFNMGSDNDDSDEKPVHQVTLDAYWIDQSEVTNAMYQQCVDAGVCRTPYYSSSSTCTNYYGASQFADYPVIHVSWEDAVTYCQWARRKLPTEAQWEKAARGTDGRTYPWGAGIDASKANYNSNIGDTSAVGSYPAGASPYGAYDMAGNVWEWVAD
jgi:formylglycine-generating enzyme required for sulfatase activity